MREGKNMKKRIVAFFSIIVLALSMIFIPEATVEATAQEKSNMRWDLSPKNPIFQMTIWESSERLCEVENEWKSVDENLKKNTVPVFGPLFLSGKFEGDKDVEWLERQMDYCEENGIKFGIQTATWNTNKPGWGNEPYWGSIPKEKLREYFQKYKNLTILQQVEVTTGLQFSRERINYMKENIEVCAEFGGLFLYKDQCYSPINGSAYAVLGEQKDLLNTFRENSENCVIMWKGNGIGQHYENQSYAMGYWLSGIVSNWGINCEGWLNVEQGYDTLGSDTAKRRSGGSEACQYRMPEAQFGQMMELCAANGATIYSYEDEWYANSWQGKATPAYEMVLKPFQERIINENLITSKDEMQSKIKVAYYQSELMKNTPELKEDFGTRLYNNLYGIRDIPLEEMKESGVQGEWFPHTGRYYVLPILPHYATEEEKEVFDKVIDHDSYVNKFKNGALLPEYMNSIYPQEYTGSSWAQRIDNKWYLMNPSENKRVSSDFDLKFYTNTADGVSGEMDEHTFAYITESKNSIKVFTDNLRIDKEVLDNQSRVSQTIQITEDGLYDLSAWVAVDDTSATLNMVINDEPRKFVNIPRSKDYKKHSIQSVPLKTGDEVKVYVTGAWGGIDSWGLGNWYGWTNVDDFSLVKQGSDENILMNPSFEDGTDGWKVTFSTKHATNNAYKGNGHIAIEGGPNAFGYDDYDEDHNRFMPDEYHEKYYLDNYDIREVRTVKYVFHGITGTEPKLIVNDEAGNVDYTTEWDEENNLFTVLLSMNGYIDFEVKGVTGDGNHDYELTKNHILNSGFEQTYTQTTSAAYWLTEWDNPESSNVSTDAKEGKYSLQHTKEGKYEVSTYQMVTGLDDGIYELTAQVKSSGGQSYASMYAEQYRVGDKGKSEVKLHAEEIPDWKEIKISDIKVVNGKCKIGFYSKGDADTSLMADSISFVKVGEIE